MAKKVLTEAEEAEKQKRADRIKACTTLAELQKIGSEVGYKEGWAVHMWDHHPNNPANNGGKQP